MRAFGPLLALASFLILSSPGLAPACDEYEEEEIQVFEDPAQYLMAGGFQQQQFAAPQAAYDFAPQQQEVFVQRAPRVVYQEAPQPVFVPRAPSCAPRSRGIVTRGRAPVVFRQEAPVVYRERAPVVFRQRAPQFDVGGGSGFGINSTGGRKSRIKLKNVVIQ
jgi:hypothetical protein